MSSYVVLARRYRPQRFQDLVGQEHVSVTLRNAVLQKRFAHAYLFTGPRGVGKTSAARILAKAIRCLNLTSEGEPCNTCDACEGVNNGSSLDVLEIDAASNTGVDNVRDLRQNVEFMAAVGKYRVYIIDEVHMLSTAAFNALLKTLEEPPPHVIFIFATTELHKILPTIQSRCQRFDFKRIAPAVMTEKLKEICAAENVSIDDRALRTLVLESEGCLRDAESLLDQAIALCGKSIKIEELSQALSLVDRGAFFKLIEAIADHNSQATLQSCHAQFEAGLEPKTLLGRLVEFFSDLHFYFFTGESRNPDPEQDELFKNLKNKLAPDEVIRALDLCLRTQGQLSASINSTYALESLVLRLSLQRPALSPAMLAGAGGVAAGISSPSSQSTSGVVVADTSAARASAPMRPVAMSESAAAPLDRQPPPAAPRSTAQAPATPAGGSVQRPSSGVSSPSKADLAKLEGFIRANKPAWYPVLQSILEVSSDEASGTIHVRVRADFAGKRLASNDGLEVLKKAYGSAKAQVTLDAGGAVAGSANNPSGATLGQTANPSLGGATIDPREKIQNKLKLAKEHEAIKAALEIFESSSIVETKVLEDEGPNSRGSHPKPNLDL